MVRIAAHVAGVALSPADGCKGGSLIQVKVRRATISQAGLVRPAARFSNGSVLAAGSPLEAPMIRSFVCAAAIVLLAAAACPRQAGAQHVRGNVQAGQELVLHHCDMCHVVANSQSLPPMPGYAPTFFEIGR